MLRIPDLHIFQILYQSYQLSPWQLPTVARQGLKFLFNNLFKPPIYPQVVITFVHCS